MRRSLLTLVVVSCAMLAAPCLAAVPQPTFCLPLDGTVNAVSPGLDRVH